MDLLPSCLLLSPNNTARPVDARWRRVVDLADRGAPASHEWDDDWVRRGLDYLTRLRSCATDGDRAALAAAVPDIDGAYELSVNPDKLARAEAEARLLARQGVEGVAAACGTVSEVVIAYEALFFCVLLRLDARSFILNCAVGGELWGGSLRESDTDVLLRLFACRHGSLVIAPLLRYFREGLRFPEDLVAATPAELEDLAFTLHLRAAVLSRVLPGDRLIRAVRLHGLARELDRYARSLRGGPAAPPRLVAEDRPLPGQPGWWAAWRSTVLAA